MRAARRSARRGRGGAVRGDITSAKRSVSPEKLAEMKFGVKGLAAALIALGVLLVAGIVLIFAIV